MRQERLGELTVTLTGGTDGNAGGDGPLVVLLHGFGAPGDDLVPLSRALPVPDGTRFAFPEAPLVLDAWGSRAWWMIDPALFEQRARGEAPDRSHEEPEGLPRAREQLLEALQALQRKLGAPAEDLVLGGFSQGSMLALDATLQLETKPRALVLLSSTLIARRRWEVGMPRCADLPVFQSHGHQDPLLPFAAAEQLRDLLQGAGAEVEFVPFAGGHALPPEVLRALAAFLGRTLPERSP